MALWRFGRGWSEETLKAYLAELAGRGVNFGTDPAISPQPPILHFYLRRVRASFSSAKRRWYSRPIWRRSR
jgi:hypothetical protein